MPEVASVPHVLTLATCQAACNELISDYESRIREALTTLLAQKHLYQHVEVKKLSARHIAKKLAMTIGLQANVADRLTKAMQGAWSVEPRRAGGYPGIMTPAPKDVTIAEPSFLLGSIKLHCAVCEGREAHNLFEASAVARQASLESEAKDGQLFVLAYQCQCCHHGLVTYLIERRLGRLTIAGRSPIEDVVVPRYVPKSLARLMRQSRIAANSNSTLAAVCLHRIAIEVHARRLTGYDGKSTDTLFDAYKAKLPRQVVSDFPSPQQIYNDLSALIHKAEASPEAYEYAWQQYLLHLEAVDMYARNASGSKSLSR